MVSDQLRNDVWLEWWDAARLSRYYSALGDRFVRFDRLLMLLILACGTASATYLLDLLPAWLQPLLGLVLAALAIWMMIANFATKAAVAHGIARECVDLEDRWKSLMETIDSADADPDATLSADTVREQMASLQKRMNFVTDPAAQAGITDHSRLNERKADEARIALENSYAL